jgi:hypothetical protein
MSAAVGVAALALASFSGCGTSTDDRPAQWSYIYPAIIEPSCATASCHSKFTDRAGVDFSNEDEAWYQLNCRHFVVPGTGGSPSSELIRRLTAQGGPRMPPDFALPAADINLIARWIEAGATDDVVTPPDTQAAICPTK